MSLDLYKPLVRTLGIPNLLQPGLAKELVIADILGHEVIPAKRQPDARASDDPSIMYEDLSCKEGGSGQFDRMFKAPLEKRERSLDRIRRNHKIYLAVFYTKNQIEVKTIYELEPDVVEREAVRQLDRSQNDISHVGFSIQWSRDHGRIVYQDQTSN